MLNHTKKAEKNHLPDSDKFLFYLIYLAPFMTYFLFYQFKRTEYTNY